MALTQDPFEPAGAVEDDADRLLLEAVRAEVLAVGLHGVTATAVARRAGLARVTLYRRSGGVKRLVLNAVTRELAGLLGLALAGLPERSGRERTIELGLRLVRGSADSAFLTAVLSAEPALFEPYLTEHLGAGQRTLISACTAEIERGIVDGSVAPQQPRVLATVLLMALTPFVTAAHIPDLELGSDATQSQLRRLIGGYLAMPDAEAAGQASPSSVSP